MRIYFRRNSYSYVILITDTATEWRYRYCDTASTENAIITDNRYVQGYDWNTDILRYSDTANVINEGQKTGKFLELDCLKQLLQTGN